MENCLRKHQIFSIIIIYSVIAFYVAVVTTLLYLFLSDAAHTASDTVITVHFLLSLYQDMVFSGAIFSPLGPAESPSKETKLP